MADEFEMIQCPFCGYQGIEVKPGKTDCPECGTGFGIDDRGECVFVDLENPMLPLEGTVCMRCGLIQGEEIESCVYCEAELNTKLQ
jgi:hypothetical protein